MAPPLLLGGAETEMIDTLTLARWLEGTAPMASAPTLTPRIAIDRQLLERLESDLGDGGKECLTELIQLFLVDFQQAIEGLLEDIKAARWERVAFEAHRLRSSTANLAAADLYMLCNALEECGQNADSTLAVELMARVHEEFPRVREALTAYMQRQPPPATEGVGEGSHRLPHTGLGR